MHQSNQQCRIIQKKKDKCVYNVIPYHNQIIALYNVKTPKEMF